jgi:MFS family permease
MLHSKAWQIAMIGLGTATTQLDTAVNIAFPAITRGFGLAIGDIQWVVICYVLAYASLLLALGRIGDTISRAVVYRTGLVGAPSPSFLSAVRPATAQCCFRCLQGVGAAC